MLVIGGLCQFLIIEFVLKGIQCRFYIFISYFLLSMYNKKETNNIHQVCWALFYLICRDKMVGLIKLKFVPLVCS